MYDYTGFSYLKFLYIAKVIVTITRFKSYGRVNNCRALNILPVLIGEMAKKQKEEYVMHVIRISFKSK